MSTNLLPVALQLALRWFCVVPVIGKAPCHAGGHGWADGSRHIHEVEWLFRTRRHTGIGIACGEASGCWVLDEDSDAGRASLQALTAKHGSLPTGPVTVTGNGRHYWFAWTPECDQLRNRVGFAAGLDVRTNGGGVVVPPSRHLDSGRRYEWQISLLDLDPPQAPEWLLTEIIGTYPAKQEEGVTHPTSAVHRPVKKEKKDSGEIRDMNTYVSRALDYATSKILTAPNGLQRTALYTEALSIGVWLVGCTPQKCTKEKAFKALVDAGEKMKNHKPKQVWTKAQIERVVNDGLEAGIGRATNAA